jgi:hypothetical protein
VGRRGAIAGSAVGGGTISGGTVGRRAGVVAGRGTIGGRRHTTVGVSYTQHGGSATQTFDGNKKCVTNAITTPIGRII